ncbi:hypothetical protein RhiirA5_417375 [Rhizophagus irregularis]|nr:hypothetical protein RhiirA5_417375 [Rhizophagus irregularis]
MSDRFIQMNSLNKVMGVHRFIKMNSLNKVMSDRFIQMNSLNKVMGVHRFIKMNSLNKVMSDRFIQMNSLNKVMGVHRFIQMNSLNKPNIPIKAPCLPQQLNTTLTWLRTGIQRPLSIFERAESKVRLENTSQAKLKVTGQDFLDITEEMLLAPPIFQVDQL